MGKGTDKLYITHSEWSGADAFGPSAGANARKAANTGFSANFKRLPFNFCSLSLQPFSHPVCTAEGITFDLTNILPWLKKHGTNPVDGLPLKSSELVKLHFAKNDEGDYVDPVTFKVLTDNTHIVALRSTGNVFAWDTVERLNIKARNWRDLVSDGEFSRKDIITLQDPQNVESRDLSKFKYLREDADTLTPEQREQRSAGVNDANLGSAAKILKAKEAVEKRRAERALQLTPNNSTESQATIRTKPACSKTTPAAKPLPYNASQYTTGRTAASFTSTSMDVSTSTARATLTEEEYLLKPRRVKAKGYARMVTNLGELKIELYPEHAPKAVWNFITLAKRGYYNNVAFHRVIKNFMVQGGDPTGTGRGGESCWGKGKPFKDEFEGPLRHDERGVISMANKGKDTNTSQFFVTFRAAKHLDRKHTVFGRVVEGAEGPGDVLGRLEGVGVGEGDRPVGVCRIEEIVVFVDPFEEFLRRQGEKDIGEARREEARRRGGEEEDSTTWTGKRIRAGERVEGKEDEAWERGVGKYLKRAAETVPQKEEVVGEWDEPEPANKKAKKSGGGSFGNFDNW